MPGVPGQTSRRWPLDDVPVYLHTACGSCGIDEGVAVRYRDSVLCLECFRDAKRAERERQRFVVVYGTTV
jgi:hypothetical protein